MEWCIVETKTERRTRFYIERLNSTNFSSRRISFVFLGGVCEGICQKDMPTDHGVLARYNNTSEASVSVFDNQRSMNPCSVNAFGDDGEWDL